MPAFARRRGARRKPFTEADIREFFPSDAHRCRPASRGLQEAHDAHRSALTGAIGRNFEELQSACPEVAEAAREYAAFLARNPSVSFRLCRAEDVELTVEAGCRVFVR